MNDLGVAAYNADLELVETLLAAGADPNEPDTSGYTPLLWASFRARVADLVPVITALITAGADPNALTGRGESNCLILATQCGSEDAVEALVAAGADVNGTADGVSALMVAARDGDKNIVELLIILGADAGLRCGNFDAADYARYGGFEELACFLAERVNRTGAR